MVEVCNDAKNFEIIDGVREVVNAFKAAAGEFEVQNIRNYRGSWCIA